MSDEVHVHGYDHRAPVAPGAPAEVRFTPDIPGVFEVELEAGDGAPDPEELCDHILTDAQSGLRPGEGGCLLATRQRPRGDGRPATGG